MIFGAAFALGAGLAFVVSVRFFLLLAVVASAVVAGIVGDGVSHMLVTGFIAFILCQVGYGLGLGIRALVTPRPQPAPEPRKTEELPRSMGSQRQQ